MRKSENISAANISVVPETLQDAADIYQYMGCDPEITKYTGWNPYQSLQNTTEKIEQDIHAEDGTYSWVIKKDGMFVGTIGAYDYQSKDLSIEIGYSIARKFWENGYAKTAARAVVAFLLSEPEIQTIRAWSHVDNAASIRILQGCGFVQTGRDGEQITFELRKKQNC